MSDTPASLARQIAELEASLLLPLPDAARLLMEQQIAALRQRRAALIDFGSAQVGDVRTGDIAGHDVRKGTEGSVTLSDNAHINGVSVGVNLGTIIYGRNTSEEERCQLMHYLARLSAKLRRMPLSGLAASLNDGEGVALSQIYVALAVGAKTELARVEPNQPFPYFRGEQLPAKDLKAEDTYNQLLDAYHMDHALPDTAVIAMEWVFENVADQFVEQWFVLYRHLLASEMITQHQRLILLGDPGGGKSTFLRYLAWVLAQRGLEQCDDGNKLLGWGDETRLLPVLLPLRRLAGKIANDGSAPIVVTNTLVHELEREYDVRNAADLLDRVLNSGSSLLLLDGLDEVPLEAVPTSASRRDTLQAVRAFADLYPDAHIVITCRTRAFSEELRTELGWEVAQIAPFTLGQIRHFAQAWFDMLYRRGSLDREKASQYTRTLIDAISASERLYRLATTPLLLTMMALVLVDRGELPRDRPLLYERILDMLLGQWDKVREGMSLAEAIGLPDWDSARFQPLLDHLSYQAHGAERSIDGRGRLARSELYLALIDFFKATQIPEPWAASERWLNYIEQRSGLLAPDGSESYVFAHLTLQEHCAGRHIALNSENPVALTMDHHADDHWREAIFLGAGLMLPAILNSLLTDLIEPDEKEPARWYRDLILAAEIGQDRDWSYLRTRPMVKVERLQRELKQGLVTLLSDASQPLPIAERIYAASLLGDLGDPRYPVTVDHWQREVERRGQAFGHPAGYFCYIPENTYTVGGGESGRHEIAVRLAPYWLARHPITVEQYASFVAEGYGHNAARWWTKNGWKWKPGERPTQPWAWGRAPYNQVNQPVIGISWYEATAYCCWLTARLRDILPPGYIIRLPTEAEWEVAAAYDASIQRRSYPWGNTEPDAECAIYDVSKRGSPTPVGCYPASIAACGAFDMAGNVLEVTTSSYRGYPEQSNIAILDFGTSIDDVPQRGGAWSLDSSFLKCGKRSEIRPGGRINQYLGFRVILAPIS